MKERCKYSDSDEREANECENNSPSERKRDLSTSDRVLAIDVDAPSVRLDDTWREKRVSFCPLQDRGLSQRSKVETHE